MKKRSHKCQKKPSCPSNGTWRSNVGLKGGGKGWCGNCLKAEDLEKLELYKDELGHLYFKCRFCSQKVRVRKENREF